MSQPTLFKIGAIFALLAIMLGAFGAHVLRGEIDEFHLTTFKTGVQYQFYHAIALFITGFLMSQNSSSKWLGFAACFFIAGIVLFSGSLYLLACNQILPIPNWIGPITPLGGLSFMIGWGCIFMSQMGSRDVH